LKEKTGKNNKDQIETKEHAQETFDHQLNDVKKQENVKKYKKPKRIDICQVKRFECLNKVF